MREAFSFSKEDTNSSVPSGSKMKEKPGKPIFFWRMDGEASITPPLFMKVFMNSLKSRYREDFTIFNFFGSFWMSSL